MLSGFAISLVYFRQDMMRDFLSVGHEVYAAAPEDANEWAPVFEKIGVRYKSIKLERNGQNPFKDIRAFFSILSLIRKIKPDVVIPYQAKPVIYGSIAAAVCGISQCYSIISGLGSVLRRECLKPSDAIVKGILQLQYKIALLLNRKVFFQNTDDSSTFERLGIVNPKKVVIINGSGVNLHHFRHAPMPEKFSFLFVGRIIRDKGILEYMAAASKVRKRYPDVEFNLIGFFDTNPTSLSREKLFKLTNASGVRFLGKRGDVYADLCKCSVFVLPSYHEGTPKSVLEAMAVGRPIITTDAPGCRDTVIDGFNGFLVPVKNIDKLVEKMIWMIEHRADAGQMGLKSLVIARGKYDVRKVNAMIFSAMGLGRYRPCEEASRIVGI